MIDQIISEDLERIRSSLKGDLFAGKNVLVTGGAGFLGSWLCDVLLGLGAEVTAVDDLSTGRIKNVDHLTENPKFRLIKSDVCTFKRRDKFDFILHMAGHASPEEYQVHPIETLQTSASGSANMAEIARKSDATLLFASTSEVYGDAEVVPTPETYWGKVNPIGPRSCYDEGKRFAEALLMAYYKQYGLDVKIPRIFNSYGPRLREDGLYGRAMSRFIMQALKNEPITVYGDGKQTRSFCYVTDTVTGLMLLTTNQEARGEVVNVGNSQEVTILELAKRIKQITGCESPVTFHPLPKDDPKRRCPDTSKLEKLAGWKPQVKFEDGLKRTIRWFQTLNPATD
ncbi:MAG: SDR family oxidoreductase [Candidatus Bathyarchaeota archaeon]|nr:SDR family oxidoreductase [Candidatus Bathyarchaeota archaeon]